MLLDNMNEDNLYKLFQKVAYPTPFENLRKIVYAEYRKRLNILVIV